MSKKSALLLIDQPCKLPKTDKKAIATLAAVFREWQHQIDPESDKGISVQAYDNGTLQRSAWRLFVNACDEDTHFDFARDPRAPIGFWFPSEEIAKSDAEPLAADAYALLQEAYHNN